MKFLHWSRQKLWGLRRGKRTFLPPILAVLAAFAGLAVGRNYLGSVSVVTGCSMAPTLEEGSRVYTAPISGPVIRGDVVVMDDGKGAAIKRVVGLPGETIYLWRGYVFIDRKILLEPYIPKRVYTLPRVRAAVFELGPHQYFVLGDNRSDSADSRLYGPVERKQIKKRITLPDSTLRARFGPIKLPPFGVQRHVALDVYGAPILAGVQFSDSQPNM